MSTGDPVCPVHGMVPCRCHEKCKHEFVLHMIQMPEGYSKPGASICKHCGEYENRQFQTVVTTTDGPPALHQALAPSVFLGPGMCMWTEDDEGNWDTACKAKWTFHEGTPHENGMKFCPMCGKNLLQMRYAEANATVDEQDAGVV